MQLPQTQEGKPAFRGTRFGTRKRFGEAAIDVTHAWERKFGIKGTKTNKPRFVTTFSRTGKGLKTLMDGRTGLGDDGLVFCGKDQTKPFSPCTYASFVA